MAADKGRDFVLKAGDGATSEAFTTVGGLRTTGLTINNEPVDITNKDSAGVQELLEAAGVQQMTVQAAGVFKGTTPETLLRTRAMAQTIDNYRLQFGDGHYFEGAFLIESLEFTGEYNGARMFNVTMRRSGASTYV